MLYVKVYDSVQHADLVREAIGFFIKELSLGDSKMLISLRVFSKSKGGVAGETFINRDQAISSVYAKSLDVQQLLEAIAHELYHVKQAVEGRLKPAENGSMEFGGVVYGLSQADSPYEVEADEWAKSISKNFYLRHFTFSSLGV